MPEQKEKPQLPGELVELVIGYIDARDTRTLATLAAVSTQMHALVVPRLYSHVVITRANARRLFRGLVPCASATAKGITKPEWDAALMQFGEAWGSLLARAARGQLTGYGSRWPAPEWASDPETEDEEGPTAGSTATASATAVTAPRAPGPVGSAPAAPAPSAAPPTPATSTSDPALWRRRLKLLAHCTHLTVVQVPSQALSRHLCAALSAAQNDNGNDGDSNGDGGDTTATVQLFPNLTYLELSPRAVRTLSFYAQLHRDDDETDAQHPFGKVLSSACGAPQHACITGVPGERDSAAEFFFRLIRSRAPRGGEVKKVLINTFDRYTGERQGRLVRAAACLPKSVRTLTVHNVRYPGRRPDIEPRHPHRYGLPYIDNASARHYRYFYDDRPLEGVCDDLPYVRAVAVTGMLKATAPVDPAHISTFEHVDVTHNTRNIRRSGTATAEQILTAASTIMAMAPHDYVYSMRRDPAPEDRDEALDEAVEAAEAECALLQAEQQAAKDLLEAQWMAERGAALDEAIARQINAEQVHWEALAAVTLHGSPTLRLNALGGSVGAFTPSGAGASADLEAATAALHAARTRVDRLLRNREKMTKIPADHPTVSALTAAQSALRAAREQADESAQAACRARIAVLQRVGAPPFEERVVFTEGAEARPCVVCGFGHRSEWNLGTLVAAAKNRVTRRGEEWRTEDEGDRMG